MGPWILCRPRILCRPWLRLLLRLLVRRPANHSVARCAAAHGGAGEIVSGTVGALAAASRDRCNAAASVGAGNAGAPRGVRGGEGGGMVAASMRRKAFRHTPSDRPRPWAFGPSVSPRNFARYARVLS